jgi:dipeptidyl aminopeptidase/acylaminoacyl peptidase
MEKMPDKKLRRNPIIFILILLGAVFSACVTDSVAVALPDPQLKLVQVTPSPSPQPPTLTPIPITPTRTPVPDKIATLTPTIDPYQDLYITTLKNRKYGGGVVQNEGLISQESGFKRFLFKYRSERLNLYGFINIPDGQGPFPVVVLLHGAVDFAAYQTVDYTRRYADALAQSGFITVNPNLRGYTPSQDGRNEFGVGDTIDVLNLISLIRTQSRVSGLLEKADGERIGVWGHSMGGGIVLRLLIVDPQIRSGLLYASVNADEVLNLVHFGNDGRREDKFSVSSSALKLISPADFLDEISVPLSIHHGADDEVVPVKWSQELCVDLKQMGKQEECFIYPQQAHTFQNDGDPLFIKRTIDFFRSSLN